MEDPAVKRLKQVQDMRWNMNNHKPTSEAVDLIEYMRALAKQFGEGIIQSAPDCRERSVALTNLEQTLMWTNAAIARNNTKDERM